MYAPLLASKAEAFKVDYDPHEFSLEWEGING